MAIPNTAITRGEQYLAAMAGQSGTLPDEPITRKEHYLAKAAGQDVETPPPITREEMYLDVIAEGGGGGGGGGATLIASGTFEGNGDYKFEIPVGKKMPQTDFVFILWVNNGTEFVRSNNLQFMTVVATVLRRFASYDLSTDGTKEALRPFWVYDNNEGTVTKKDSLMVYGCEQTIRIGWVQGPGMMGPQFGTKVKRSTSGFSFIMSKAASDYQFVSGMTYNWELLYIGSDPTNDIVEVP